jgi:hypothetical protein
MQRAHYTGGKQRIQKRKRERLKVKGDGSEVIS